MASSVVPQDPRESRQMPDPILGPESKFWGYVRADSGTFGTKTVQMFDPSPGLSQS
jgi:hypothetical protein